MPFQEPQPPKPNKRKAAISPELREFLQMLNSLEAELEARQQPAR